MLKKQNIFPMIMMVFVALKAGPTLISILRGPAPTPDIFASGYTLEQASELSEESGKPMLVLATLDSCPPCQTLKRTTMVDPMVIDWVNEHTIPVYLESSVNRDEISTLPIRSYPTTFLIADGKISALEGAVSSKELINEFSQRLPMSP